MDQHEPRLELLMTRTIISVFCIESCITAPENVHRTKNLRNVNTTTCMRHEGLQWTPRAQQPPMCGGGT